MMKKIRSFRSICRVVRKLQKEGQRVVFVHGFFDILYRGHVTLLVKAKKLGDVLVVGVDHDDNARIIKGPGRPINDHDSRMFVLSQLEPVDYVFLIPSFKENKKTKRVQDFFCDQIYAELGPDIIATCVKAGKYRRLKEKHARAAGAKFVDVDHGIYDVSATNIIEKLKKG
jgi:D-beta-D-heptose 7-phosphate kinase/D-beta-D-heptose 1-phosphate adenosyltransferase